jgi:hypothetical protein
MSLYNWTATGCGACGSGSSMGTGEMMTPIGNTVREFLMSLVRLPVSTSRAAAMAGAGLTENTLKNSFDIVKKGVKDSANVPLDFLMLEVEDALGNLGNLGVGVPQESVMAVFEAAKNGTAVPVDAIRAIYSTLAMKDPSSMMMGSHMMY